MGTHTKRAENPARLACVLVSALVLSLAAAGCDDGEGEAGPADFYVTAKLNTGTHPRAVDVLEVVLALTDGTMMFEETSGSQYEEGIIWESRLGSAGYELAVELSGEYFEANAMEVAADTYEIDIPFSGEAAECNIRGTAKWRNLDNMLVDIAFGTAHIDGLNLPLATGTRIPVEVNCLPDYGWTCRTGCDDTMLDCPDGVEDCGSGYFDCVDGCCVPAE